MICEREISWSLDSHHLKRQGSDCSKCLALEGTSGHRGTLTVLSLALSRDFVNINTTIWVTCINMLGC